MTNSPQGRGTPAARGRPGLPAPGVWAAYKRAAVAGATQVPTQPNQGRQDVGPGVGPGVGLPIPPRYAHGGPQFRVHFCVYRHGTEEYRVACHGDALRALVRCRTELRYYRMHLKPHLHPGVWCYRITVELDGVGYPADTLLHVARKWGAALR